MKQLQLVRAFTALVRPVKRKGHRYIRRRADNRFQRFVLLRREAEETVDINLCSAQ
ncbi:hypothetical protein D3C84_1112380 [compost metagenome]